MKPVNVAGSTLCKKSFISRCKTSREPSGSGAADVNVGSIQPGTSGEDFGDAAPSRLKTLALSLGRVSLEPLCVRSGPQFRAACHCGHHTDDQLSTGSLQRRAQGRAQGHVLSWVGIPNANDSSHNANDSSH
eukprot:6627029-Prymnesium_polylepis.1